MKILHIIDSGGLYGAEVMLLNLMQEQVRMGLEPILASIGDPDSGEKKIEQEARRLGLRCKVFRFKPGPNLSGAYQVLRFAWQEKIDILHSHGYKGNILFGFLPKFIRRMPMVATVHGWTWTGGMTRMMVYEWLDSRSLARMDRVILVNGAMKNHSRLKGRSKLALDVVANGIQAESSIATQADESTLNPDIIDFCRGGYTIGAIGRLSPEKGFDLLITAVSALVAEGHDVRLAILGEGGLRNELEASIKRLDLEKRVFMPGYVQDAKNYLRFFSLFAMPSLTEGLPMVLLEAMQAAVPIVATRVGGIPDVLQEGKCGLLIKPDCREELEGGIVDVIQDPESANKRVHAAKSRVADTYSSRVMAERYLAIYRSVKIGGTQ